MPEPAEAIRERARKVVKGVREDDVGVYRMVKRMVAHTIKEYRGRFLHELVQNGYDAHPAGTEDGRIAIHFDETEGHGVLYVANGGQPLTESNFERMASLGESDKTIGVGIGNKGVGFKSVFQICDVPEVYSARDLDDLAFSGFSFRFGTHQDLLEHLDGDVELAEQVAENLSLSMLTVPLAEAPETVKKFREQGYVTVLRLPANDERAASEIRERMTRLMDPAAPIMLFLDRLTLLSIKSGSTEKARRLTRQVPPGGDGTGSTTVVLDKTNEFRLFSAQVPQELLKAALRDSVEEGALDERWLEWDAEAHVSVAVGRDQAVSDGRAFTYLPMGDGARSLLAGHMNAPFVTNFARVDLDHEQPVNRLMVDRIAELCLDSVAALAQGDEDANLVVDLVAWHDRLDDLLRTCRDRRGTDLTRFVTLPTRRGMWRDLESCHLWRWTDTRHLDEALVTAHTDADLLDPDLIDVTRLSAVAVLAEALGAPLEPAQDLLADWVESIAGAMLSDQVEVATWSLLYDDLKRLFEPEGVALRGRKILLTSANTLAPCDEPAGATGSGRGRRRRHRSVFFYPRRSQEQEDDEDVTDEALPAVGTGSEANIDVRTPQSLEDRIVFMHPQLEWNPGGVNRDGRTFLEDAHLVQIFRTEPLLKLLGRVLESSTSNRVKRDALEFAFRLMGGDPRRHARELSNVGLQVPTASGRWVRASQALFGEPWDVPGAAEISALASGASAETPELATLADLVVATPEAMPRLEAPLDPQRWIDFLSILGVTATLPVRTTTDPRSIAGRYLNAARIVGGDVPEAVPPGVREQWGRGLDLGGNHHHPETPFTTADPICWFTGQHEVQGLPRRLRGDYALLLIRTLPTLKPWHWLSTWRRKRSGGWESHGATPLACFVREEPWLLVSRSGAEQLFGAPRETWHVTAEDQMAANYSPLLEPKTRRTLAGVPDARTSLERQGLRIWGSPAHAPALIDHLTGLFEGRDLGEVAIDHLRSALAKAWHDVGEGSATGSPTLGAGLLVERGGHLELLDPADPGEERVVVMDTNDQTTASKLIRELGWPVVAVESADRARLEKVREALRTQWDTDVVLASEWEFEVMADGLPWQPRDDDARLCDEFPWLPLLVACTMRYPRSGQRVGKQLERHMDDLARVRLVRCERITLASASGPEELPRRLRGTLPIPGPLPTLLVEQMGPALLWKNLGKVAEGALELIEQARFTADLALNISRLAGDPEGFPRRPDAAELADVLDVAPVQITETESRLFGAVSGLVARLQPTVAATWGADALYALTEATTSSRDDLLAVLVDLCGDRDAAELLLARATDAPDADVLRRAMGIDLAVYNATMLRDFPELRPIDNSAAQLEEFNLRRSQRRGELLTWIRSARLTRFESLEVQTDLPGLRDLAFLVPDEKWGTSLDDLSEEVVDARIDTLMAAAFGAHGPDGATDLPDWNEVRQANGHPLRERLEAVGRVVHAWQRKQDTKVDSVPVTTEEYVDIAMRALDAAGALDFVPLDDDMLLLWLEQVGCWPNDMPASIDPPTLGLTEADLDAAATEREAAREARIRAERQVSLHGEVLELDLSMHNLVQRISEHLATAPTSLDTPYRILTPQHMEPRTRRGRPGGGGGPTSGGGRPKRMSDAQRDAVGLAGEMTAFHWLKAKDPSPVDETCWKSTYVSLVFEGVQGRDDLGYDFAVPRADGPVMYEVKATTGEAGMIELGETEVACAQEHAHGRGRKWRLLVVEDVLSTQPRVLVLPNPFHRDTRSMYRFDGNSMRLRFKI